MPTTLPTAVPPQATTQPVGRERCRLRYWLDCVPWRSPYGRRARMVGLGMARPLPGRPGGRPRVAPDRGARHPGHRRQLRRCPVSAADPQSSTSPEGSGPPWPLLLVMAPTDLKVVPVACDPAPGRDYRRSLAGGLGEMCLNRR